MKVDLTVIFCVLYIAVPYNSDRNSKTEKLKMTGNRKKKVCFRMAYKDQFNTLSHNYTAFTMKLRFYRKIRFDPILERRGTYFSRC